MTRLFRSLIHCRGKLLIGEGKIPDALKPPFSRQTEKCCIYRHPPKPCLADPSIPAEGGLKPQTELLHKLQVIFGPHHKDLLDSCIPVTISSTPF